jgi:hypothetical protein
MRVLLAAIAGLVGLALMGPVIALGLPFWLTSVLTRCLAPLCSPKAIRWPELFEYDSALGWKAKANLSCHCLEERDDIFYVATDADGWPGKAKLSESAVVVFGDSYAFGYGVDHASSFLQLNPTLPLKAFGVPGYNQVQQLFLMRRLSSQLKGKLVLWWIYVGNDLFDNMSPEMSGYRAPFVRRANGRGNWEIVTSHLSPAKWTCSRTYSPRSYPYPLDAAIHSETFLSQRAYSACEFLLRSGKEVCDKAGATLVVMTIPAPFSLNHARIEQARVAHPSLKALDADFPDKKLNEICEALGVRFVPLKKYLDIGDYKERDDHWNERGHKRVVDVLSNLYREHVSTLASEHSDRGGARSFSCSEVECAADDAR